MNWINSKKNAYCYPLLYLLSWKSWRFGKLSCLRLLLVHIRRLSVLRENFKACNLKSLKYDIPLMALTATATIHVREDILKSLRMSKETKIVLTSFFRPNLRFSVSCFLLFLPLCQYET